MLQMLEILQLQLALFCNIWQMLRRVGEEGVQAYDPASP